MLERFIILITNIQNSLIDINHLVRLEDPNFDFITMIIDVLTPVKLTVDAFGRRNANLCTANATLKFLFKELFDKNQFLLIK